MQRIMKKTIAILLSVSCLFGLNSCFKTEDDIFDQSPAQRLNQLTSDYREVLSGAEDGWVLQYFASETEQGYPFVMKFDKNGSVTIAANNSVSTGGTYKEEKTTYDFVQDMSVVLTFDTYNEIFHEFSSPADDGVGHGGDYEFQMKRMSENKDTIYVMGKKTGIDMRLVRFPKGAQYTDAAGATKTVDTWADYFTAISANTARLFNSKLPAYTLTAAGESFKVTDLGSGVMTIVPSDATDQDAASRTYYRGVIVNLDNTVLLSSPFTGENDKFSVQNFKLTDDGSKMVSTDAGQDATLGLPSLSTLLVSDGLTWTMAASDVEGQFKTAFDAAATGLANYAKGVKLQSFIIGYDAKENVNYLNVKTNKFQGKLYVNITAVDDSTVKFAFTGTGDKNGTVFLKNVAELQQIIALLQSGDFKLSTEKLFTPLTVTIANATNAADKALLKL